MNTQRTWRNQFGEDWAVPAEILNDRRFEDISWGNDAAPSFRMKGCTDEVVLFVDHPDVTMREFPDGKRFTVSDSKEGHEAGFETDDVAEAIAKYLEMTRPAAVESEGGS